MVSHVYFASLKLVNNKVQLQYTEMYIRMHMFMFVRARTGPCRQWFKITKRHFMSLYTLDKYCTFYSHLSDSFIYFSD